MDDFDEQLESLKQHILDSGRQAWLFGAGISYDANIPLMYPLTDRVTEIINASDCGDSKEIIGSLKVELTEESHIEHYLSHLGDLMALAERSRNKTAHLSGNTYTFKQLERCYRRIISAIGSTVRHGYRDNENIGSTENSIVDISTHLRFVRALFKNKANLERRSSTTFFTTNYDTLLEDALVLEKKNVVDGFSGGAMGFWNADYEFSNTNHTANSCLVYKLHGSIDWHRDALNGLVRVRYGTNYVSDLADIMIYPQATKYVETQKDPFASLFLGLRTALRNPMQNVLITCGYSFGDEHINAEIEVCLESVENKTTVIAFTDEKPTEEITINPTLDRWLKSDLFGERVFVAGKKGLYNNSLKPSKPEKPVELGWWTFSGLTKFLSTGDV